MIPCFDPVLIMSAWFSWWIMLYAPCVVLMNTGISAVEGGNEKAYPDERLLDVEDTAWKKEFISVLHSGQEIDAPKHVDLKDFVPVFDAFPRRTLWRDACVVEEDADLDARQNRERDQRSSPIHEDIATREYGANLE